MDAQGAGHMARRLLAVVVAVVLPLLGANAAAAQAIPPVSGTAVESPPAAPALWRVHFATQRELQAVTARYDVWEVHHADGFLVAALDADDVATLEAAGHRVEPDAGTRHHIAEQVVQPAATDTGIPGFSCYRTVEETYADLAALAGDYPNLATWTDIGDSWEKTMPGGAAGYDLFALRLTNRDIPGPKPKFIVMAAIHAREYVTAEVATRFAEDLAAGYGTDPEITWLLDHFEFHLLPQANPDGRKIAEAGVLWRKNTNSSDGCFSFSSFGIDLNRNSSFKWNECDGFGCSSGSPCDLTYRGRGPTSEPETQAIQSYLSGLLPDRRGPGDDDAAPLETESLFISIHSYSELILFPWGWTAGQAPNHAGLQTLARKFAYFTDYRACQAGAPGCLYRTDGTTDDWSYGTLGVASFTFELGTTFFQRCTDFENTILPDTLAALQYGFKAARRPYLAPAGPEVTAIETVLQTATISKSLQLTVTADDGRTVSDPVFGREPVQTVAAARYTVDAPSWVTGTVHHPLNPPQSISTTAVLTAVVDLNLLTQPRHLLFVEAQDAAGRWGVPTAVYVDVALDYLFAVEGAATVRGRMGETVTHTLTVTNTGLRTDTYSLTAQADPWIGELRQFEGAVDPGGNVTGAIVIRIPPSALPGERVPLAVEIHSGGDPARILRREFIVQVDGHRIYLPLIGRAGPGNEVPSGP